MQNQTAEKFGDPQNPSDVQLDTGETLAQAAYRALRIDIIRGIRPPGERLRIEKLRTLYAVGPTPLREALQMLATDGLVLAEGNRGFTVAPLDNTEIEDLNIARTAIESTCSAGLSRLLTTARGSTAISTSTKSPRTRLPNCDRA